MAEDVIRQINLGHERVRQSIVGANTLKFASTHTVSILFFPEWFHSIEGVPEHTGLSLQADHMDSCTRALIHSDCHFMLCLTNADSDLGFNREDYASKTVGRDFLVPVSAANEDGTPLYLLPGSSDKLIPHLVYSERSALGQMVGAMLGRRQTSNFLKRHSESPAAVNLKSLVEEKHGVAWIASMRVNRASDHPPLVQAGDDSWRIPVDITIFRANGNLPAVADNFWDTIEEL